MLLFSVRDRVNIVWMYLHFRLPLNILTDISSAKNQDCGKISGFLIKDNICFLLNGLGGQFTTNNGKEVLTI